MTGIILQARMGSSRLPGKVMMDLGGKPLLGRILARLRKVRNADRIVVATTTRDIDDAIEVFVQSEHMDCFRGSERDVLDRYYQAALRYGFSDIVRATADNPLVDPEEVDRVILHHLRSGADYTHEFGQLPVGVGVECFTLQALERSWRDGMADNHREHVNEYIHENPRLFRIEQVAAPARKIAPALRLTIDTPEDLALVRSILAHAAAGADDMTTEDAIRACAWSSA